MQPLLAQIQQARRVALRVVHKADKLVSRSISDQPQADLVSPKAGGSVLAGGPGRKEHADLLF